MSTGQSRQQAMLLHQPNSVRLVSAHAILVSSLALLLLSIVVGITEPLGRSGGRARP